MGEQAQRVNQRPGACTECGGEVPAGAGALWYEPGPDDGGDVVGRTPAGWRVTHLDVAACARVRAEREAERRTAAAAGKARADEARAAYERTLADLDAEVARWVTERGLVPAPHDCTLPVFAQDDTEVLFEREVYPACGGFSTGSFGRVVARRSDGLVVARRGANEESLEPQRWASPALVAAGVAHYRVHQWWQPSAYGPESYPGPAVPEAELTADERALVAQRRAEASAEVRRRNLRGIEIGVRNSRELAHVLGVPGATWEIDYGAPAALDAYLAAVAQHYSSRAWQDARLTVTLRVALPAACYDARGRLRAAVARRVHTEPVRLDVHVSVVTEVRRGE